MDYFPKAIVDKIERTKDGCVLNVPNGGTFGLKVYLSLSDMIKIVDMVKIAQIIDSLKREV